jgi:hypothetical protein
MRATLTSALVAVSISASWANSSPALAQRQDPYDYPYCLQGRVWGYPGNCQFTTYQQCLWTASGTDAYCGANPRFLFRYPSQHYR